MIRLNKCLLITSFSKTFAPKKRSIHVQKKAFLIENISFILQHKIPPKYKAFDCPIILCSIGNHPIILLSVCETSTWNITTNSSCLLQLIDWSMKIPRSIVEDVLILVDKFYFSVDSIVSDTQLAQDSKKHIPIILGQLFFATADSHIQCRIGNMQLSFGNMTMELNIFNISKQPPNKNEWTVDVDLIDELVDHTFHSILSDDLVQTCLTHFSLNFDINRSIDEVNVLLHSSSCMDIDKWKSRIEQLAQ